jgi:WAP-type (Whey Acidic Protein) 'four-disulfide core'
MNSIVLLTGGILLFFNGLAAGQTGASGSSFSTKSGTCPVNSLPASGSRQCYRDSNCSGRQKCCQVGSTAYFYCANPKTATTLPPTSLPKYGNCPDVQSNAVGSCVLQCNTDSSCSGNLKCCSNGCGMVCRAPVTPTVTTIKSGSCPAVSGNSMNGWCDQRCTTDGDCAGTNKCCSNGCGKRCLTPVTLLTGPVVKAGRCSDALTFNGGCVMQCSSDGHCSGTSKCCRNACANVCVRPIPDSNEDGLMIN